MKQLIIPIASYPKSGNTWVRALMTSVWKNGGTVDINSLNVPNAASRQFLDNLVGFPTAYLSDYEVTTLRPYAYNFAVSQSSERSIFLKIHDVYVSSEYGSNGPILEANLQAIVYLVRDPRDVAVSLSRHLGKSLSDVTSIMCDNRFTLSLHRNHVGPQVPQTVSSWSRHVESWTYRRKCPVFVMRYEDLLRQPNTMLARLLRFVRIPFTADLVAKATHSCDFRRLQKQEMLWGFSEKPRGSEPFFFEGRAGSWRQKLSSRQLDELTKAHGAMMSRLGYT